MNKKSISLELLAKLSLLGAGLGLVGAGSERILAPELAAPQQRTLSGKATAIFRLPEAWKHATAPDMTAINRSLLQMGVMPPGISHV